jgi:hypothetical protein
MTKGSGRKATEPKYCIKCQDYSNVKSKVCDWCGGRVMSPKAWINQGRRVFLPAQNDTAQTMQQTRLITN